MSHPDSWRTGEGWMPRTPSATQINGGLARDECLGRHEPPRFMAGWPGMDSLDAISLPGSWRSVESLPDFPTVHAVYLI